MGPRAFYLGKGGSCMAEGIWHFSTDNRKVTSAFFGYAFSRGIYKPPRTFYHKLVSANIKNDEE
jgi:hypothetical protein